MAAVLILGPICEADLQPEQYAYRPDRSALDAVQQVHAWLKTGYTEVVDADLSGYFDSIPHAELMKSVARRVSDRHMLHLIKMWLQTPVEEVVDQYTRHRLRQWLRAKHKLHRGAEKSRFPDQYLEQQLGLIRLRAKTRTLPWANA